MFIQKLQNLSDLWQSIIKEWIASGARDRKEPIPPCPSCGGKMEPWDSWSCGGETCASCGFSNSDAGG